MAVIHRALSAIAFCSMEYRQSDPFLQKTNASGIVQSPYNGTSSSQLGQINCNDSFLTTCMPFPTNPEAGSMSLFLGNTIPMANPERSHDISQICTGLPGRVTKKHKQVQDDSDCPSKKRKLSPSPVFEDSYSQVAYAGDAALPCWNSSQLALPPVIQPLGAQASEMQPILTEEMEDAPAESQTDVALRRIRDIDSRLVIEDEDHDEEEKSITDRLPTLVMSNVLIESLKQGLDESLTKKIVDSISRPSMELVLWRPQPECIGKLQNFTSKSDSKATKKGQSTPEINFLQNIGLLREHRPQTVTLETDRDPIWSKEEEEMEL